MPLAPRLLERVERVAVGSVADGVHGDGETGLRGAPDDLRELLAARDLDARAVEHARRLRAERAVHEDLEIAELEARAAEAARDAEGGEVVHLLGRQRLPHAQRQGSLRVEALPEPRRPEPAVLVVH